MAIAFYLLYLVSLAFDIIYNDHIMIQPVFDIKS